MMATRAAMPWKELITGRRAAALGLVVFLIAAMAALWSFLPLGEMMWNFASWIRALGDGGVLVFAGLFVVGVLLMVPASILYMAAGLLYDFAFGFLISVAAATSGALLQFVIARYLARDRVCRTVEKRAEFQAVDKAVEEESWKVVLLLRLAPLVPGNTQGWLFGVTGVSLIQFTWASFVAILPWALLFSGIGSAGAAALYRGENPLGLWQWALVGLGIVGLFVIVRIVGKRARAKLEAMGIRVGSRAEAG